MSVTQLHTFSRTRYLQHSQTLCLVCSGPNHTVQILVFDSDNGHWLDPADDMKEVGYLSNLREPIRWVEQLIAGGQQE
jgi:hypothetical protein